MAVRHEGGGLVPYSGVLSGDGNIMVRLPETESTRRVLYFHHQTELRAPGFLQVLDHIDQHRYAPWVVLPGDGTLRDELTRRDVPVTIAPPKRVPRVQRYTALAQPGEVSRGRRIISEVAPQLVHINSTALELIYAGIAARLCAVPVVWHVRETADRRTRSELVAKLIRGCAARVIAVSQAAAAWLGSSLNGQVVIIPDCIDTELFSPHRSPSPELRGRFGLTARVPSIGHIGLMVPARRVKDFIRAAAVVNRSVEAQFVIVNSDPGRYTTLVRDLRRLAKELGVLHGLQFVSSNSDAAELFSCLDIVVASSASRSLSPALLKAVACGKPIVATRTDAVPAGIVHGETGLLVAPGDVDGLAGAVLTLIDNPELAARMGANARLFVMRHFGARHIADRIQTLYDEVIAEAIARSAGYTAARTPARSDCMARAAISRA